MLSLEVDGQMVELPEDFSISLNLNSPIFYETGSNSLPFKLKKTANVQSIIGFRDRVENSEDHYRILSAELKWNNITFFRGSLKILSADSDSYSCSMYGAEGDFYFSAKDQSLTSFDYGNQDSSGNEEAMDWINGCNPLTYPSRPCAFPRVYNDAYFEGQPDDDRFKSFNYYQLSDGKIHKYDDILGNYTIIPNLYLKFVLNTMIAQKGYYLAESFFDSHADFNKLVLYNSVDINQDFAAPLYTDISHILFNYHVPRVSVADFLRGLELYFNIRVFVNNLKKSVRIISVDQIIKDRSSREFSSGLISLAVDMEEKITGYHLKMELDDGDDSFEDIEANFNEMLKNLKGSVQSVSDLPAWPNADPLEIRFVIDENRFYFLLNMVWIPSSDSSLVFWNHYIYITAQQTITAKCATLRDGSDIFVKCTNALGDWSEVSLRLMFTQRRLNAYSKYEVLGMNHTSSNSLFYGGTTGIFLKHYKAYVDFMLSAKTVKAVKQMEFIELLDFDFSEKKLIHGVKYMVEQIKVTIKKNKILPANITMKTCKV